MAELAFIASVVQLADIGAGLALNLFSIAESVKSAASDARLIATEVTLFSNSLRAVGKSLDGKLESNNSLKQMVESLMTSCKDIIHELSGYANSLAVQSGHQAKLFGGLKWTFKKPRVNFLRSLLESLKSSMLLLIASIDLTGNEDARRSYFEMYDLWCVQHDQD